MAACIAARPPRTTDHAAPRATARAEVEDALVSALRQGDGGSRDARAALRPYVRELHAAGATAEQTTLALRWLLRDAVLPWLPPVVARTLLETALFVAATEYRKAG